MHNLASYYSGKKVFITGHTGFKGSWLTACLSNFGAQLKGYALAPEYDNGLFNSLQPLKIIDSTIADIRNRELLKAAINSFQPDYIFHLAAQPLVRRSYKIPTETFDINVTGTANLLEAVTSLQKKCAVIVITTDKVYQNKEQDILYNETDILGGYDPYSASKACTELVVSSFRDSFFNLNTYHQHQKSVASVRAGNVIGGGDRSTDRIIPDIVRSLEQHKTIEVRNPGSIRPWQYVLEPIAGYLLLAGALSNDPMTYSKPYNFGPVPADHLTVGQLVETAIAQWGNGNWKTSAGNNAQHEAELLKLDISRAKKELGWQPKITAEEAIKWTIDWYKKPVDQQADFTFQQINEYFAL